MTELALIKLTRPDTSSDEGAILARMERIERRLDAQTTPVAARPSAAPPPVTSQATEVESKEAPATETPETEAPTEAAQQQARADTGLPELDVTLEQLNNVWAGLFGSLRDVLGARRWAYFREAVPAAVDGSTIVLEVAHDFHYQSLQSDDAVSSIVATRASDLLGSQVGVRFRLKPGSGDESRADTPEIDLDDLEDRPQPSTDPTELLAAELGAEVVDD